MVTVRLMEKRLNSQVGRVMVVKAMSRYSRLGTACTPTHQNCIPMPDMTGLPGARDGAVAMSAQACPCQRVEQWGTDPRRRGMEAAETEDKDGDDGESRNGDAASPI
jgi:hypothetical protein